MGADGQFEIRALSEMTPDENGWIRIGDISELGEFARSLSGDNINAANTTNTDELWAGGGLGLDLTGDGYTIGLWDTGVVRATHQEFGGRVTVQDATAPVKDHATHVAGTMGAAGVDANAKGMAGEVDIWSYDVFDDDNNPDDLAELRSASGSIVASNHSYGSVEGWAGILAGYGLWQEDRSQGDEDADFGKYSARAAELDDVIYDNPHLLSVWSAGNDHLEDYADANGTHYLTFVGQTLYLIPKDDATYPAPDPDGSHGGGYDCLPAEHTAKNTLVVGAVNDDPTTTIAAFSSRGATDDGRIKPDVVGNGVELYSSMATSDTSYGIGSGTSMAAPNVTGTSVLLMEHFNDEFGLAAGSPVLSATMKGLIIHTASDQGNTGPDYTYGWGLVDAAAAADFITEAASATPESHVFEETYYGGEWRQEITWNGIDPINTTIVWADPAAPANTGGLDDATSALVNDLDLWITDPTGTVYHPWTLDPSNPSNAAVQNAANHRDNVEQVSIGSPGVAGTYTIHVGSTGGITNGSQAFSILIDGATVDADVAVDAGVLAGDSSSDSFDVSIAEDDYIKTLINSDESLAIWTTVSRCDTFTINGSTDNDIFNIEDLSDFSGVTTVNSGGGIDDGYIEDSTGNDAVVFDPVQVLIDLGGDSDNDIILNNIGFVDCLSQNGGTDVAYFYGSAEDDEFLTNGSYATVNGSGFYGLAEYFEEVYAYTGGGDDVARFYSGAGDDAFTATPLYCQGDYALGLHTHVEDVEWIVVHGDLAEDDVAVVEGSSFDDSVLSAHQADTSRVNLSAVSGGDTYEVRVYDVADVSLDTKAGSDDITVYDTAGTAALTASPNLFTLEATTGSLDIQGAEMIVANAIGTGTNTAVVYDSADNDEFVVDVENSVVTMDYNYDGDAIVEVTINGCNDIQAYSTQGGDDVAAFYDSSGDDAFTAYPLHSTLSGTGFSARVDGFSSVDAFADNGGVDTAYLYDSAAPIISPGMTITPYSGGIVGVVLEVDLPGGAVIDASDFQFQVYDGGAWVAGPTPDGVLVRLDEGTSGKDQIIFSWDHGSITDEWFEITVLASGDVGVASDEVLYFGSLRGDLNGSKMVDGSDVTILASHWQQTGAGLTGGDINLDGIVDGSDVTILSGHWQQTIPNLPLSSSTVVDGYLYHGFAGNDTFTAAPGVASMNYGSDASVDIQLLGAQGFDAVEAFSQAGADTVNLSDSASNDAFVLTAAMLTMDFDDNSDINVTAHEFRNINADFSQGGSDSCTITGSTGDDDLSTTSSSLTVDYDPSVFALDLVLSGLDGNDLVIGYGNGGDDTDNSGLTDFVLQLFDWT
jgi:hypothetical protein